MSGIGLKIGRKIGRKGGRSLRALVAVVIAGLLLTASASADEQEGFDFRLGPEPVNRAAVVFDLLILRPIGVVSLAVGAAALLPVALLTAPNGRDSVETALELFVRAPMDDVFRRKLGDF